MKKYWSAEELQEFWKLLPEEKELLGYKRGSKKFLYLLALKYYAIDYTFPIQISDIPEQLLNFGLKQYAITVTTDEITKFLNNYHNYIRYQNEIRSFHGVSQFSHRNQDQLNIHLDRLALESKDEERLEAEIILLLRKLKIERPSKTIIQNLIKDSLFKAEQYLFQYITHAISSEIKSYIDDVLLHLDKATGETLLTLLKQGSGKSNRDAIAVEIEKLKVIKPLQIKASIIPVEVSLNMLKFYKRKIVSDTPEQIRARPDHIRYPLIIIFCYLKQQEVIDNLAEHLINFVHKIKKKADKTENAINNEIGKLSRGLDALYQVAEVARDNPESIIQEAIYPVVSKEQIEAIIKARYLQKNLTNSVRDKVIQSYSIHYRKKIFDIINVLDLKSTNTDLLTALSLIKKYQHRKNEHYPLDEKIPIDDLVTKKDQEFVCTVDENKKVLISKKDYEYAIFKTLRDKLKHKEVWLDGAFKYKDPTTDLPADFDNNRPYYYELLKQPLLAQEFIHPLKSKLTTEIKSFDKTILKNPHVVLTKRKGKPWIKLSPLTEQPKPLGLERLKESIRNHWKVINLLDILKEVDLRENFTECFTSSGNREILASEEVQKRLIMCLFAMGTNTGLHRVSSASTNPVSLEDLKYIKRKFINQDDLREAITRVVNAIFKIRNPEIWGESTTACAADSRKFISWDQNLMTEWHARYHGAGIMIYWHVNKQSICIHSQLKTCSSSEVASMLQGIISQDTDMKIEAQYVDSHGKSELGFALSYLLGFDLLPRYAEIGPQKIYLPDVNFTCKNITDITTRAINWELIREHYNSLVKYASALKIGTATADSIIRQFSRTNFQNPIFKAFMELGRAVKSIFVCRYLSSLELRQEIHSGLNIVENWNSINDFIFYGKKSEINSNSRDEQEYSMLCLHLLQVSITYINILLVQDIISPELWRQDFTDEDRRGLTPLFNGHINPYGTFELDMAKRLSLKEAA